MNTPIDRIPKSLVNQLFTRFKVNPPHLGIPQACVSCTDQDFKTEGTRVLRVRCMILPSKLPFYTECVSWCDTSHTCEYTIKLCREQRMVYSSSSSRIGIIVAIVLLSHSHRTVLDFSNPSTKDFRLRTAVQPVLSASMFSKVRGWSVYQYTIDDPAS